MLTLDKINYSKNHKKIISNFGFSLGLGSCLTITGKNGCGKSTLLKIIAGLISLNSYENSGQILWNNHIISGKGIDPLQDSSHHLQKLSLNDNSQRFALALPISKEDFYSDVSYIGHNNFLKQNLSVLDNLLFYTQINQSEMLLPAAFRYFQLEEITNIAVKKLSQGWQKRVILSKLLCCPATIWILDEPTNNLDKQGKELLFNLVSTRIKENGIVIIATHDDIFSPIATNINLEDFK